MDDSASIRDEPTKEDEVNKGQKQQSKDPLGGGLVCGMQQLQLQESHKKQQPKRSPQKLQQPPEALQLQARDSINLFLPCRDRHTSIAVSYAVREVRAKYNAKQWRTYWINNKSSVENHYCGLCGASFDFHVFKHFLSPVHINKIRDLGGSISLRSLRYLLDLLQKAADWATRSSKHEEQEDEQESHNPLDIFKLCRADAPDSISFVDAINQVRAKFNECGMKKWEIYCRESSHEAWLVCEVCKKDLRRSKYSHLSHFLSLGHKEKMLRSGGAVSLPALQHWLNELQLAADVQLPADPPPKPENPKKNKARFVPLKLKKKKKGGKKADNKNKNNTGGGNVAKKKKNGGGKGANKKKNGGEVDNKIKTGNGTANNNNKTSNGTANVKNKTGNGTANNKVKAATVFGTKLFSDVCK